MAAVKMATSVFYFISVIIFSITYNQPIVVGEGESDKETNVEEKERYTDIKASGNERDDRSDWLERDDSLMDTDQRIVDNELKNEEDGIKGADESHEENGKMENINNKLEEKGDPVIELLKDTDIAVDKENLPINGDEISVGFPEDHKSGDKQGGKFKDASYKRELIQLFTDQLVIVENLLKNRNIGKIQRQGKSEFDELIESMEKKSSTTTRVTTEATQKQTVVTSPVITIIDETMVREALRKDPLMMRIMEMAKRKRDKYLTQSMHNKQSLW